MTWLTPLTGLLLAAAVVPPLLLLYFLKLRRRPAPVSCTLLWKKSLEDLRANAPFQRLRYSVLLLLQLIALLLVALALMQPQIDVGQRRGGRFVLLIDNSASMNTLDGDPEGRGRSRLEQAKALAKARVERLFGTGLFSGPPGQIMVIAFADRPEVRTPFTDSRQQIIEAIETIEQSDGGTAVAEAFSLARAFTTTPDPDDATAAPEAPASLELFSDGRISDLDTEVLKPGESLVYNVVGRAGDDNVGLVSLAAQRPYESQGQIQVFAALANFGAAEISTDVQLSVNGTVQAITPKPIRVPGATVDPTSGAFVAGREQIAFLPFEQPRSAVVEVALLREDALEVDNVANIVIPPSRRLRVALVDEEEFFLPGLLDDLKLTMISDVQSMTGAQFDALAEAGELESFDVIVIDDYAAKRLPAGRYLSFGAAPPLEGFNEFGVKGQLFVRSSKTEHPIMQSVDLSDLYIHSMRAITAASDIEVLAEAPEGPIILHASRGPVQVLHVSFNPLDSNGPLGHNFVTLVCQAIEWLGTSRDALTREGLRPGQPITARLPPSARDVRMRQPDGRETSVATPDPELFAWGPVKRVGLYDLTWEMPGGEGRESRAFAVNLFSESEGRIDPRETLTLGQEQVVGRRPEQSLQTPLWPWALATCIAVLMLEWWVYVRRTGV